MLRKLRQKMRRAQDQKGFTLVELMVVVVILGILVAIAVPLYNAQTEKAKEATCFANQRIIESAIMQWQTEEGNAGKYPDNLDNLAAYLQATPVCPDKDGEYNLKDGKVTCSEHDHYSGLAEEDSEEQP